MSYVNSASSHQWVLEVAKLGADVLSARDHADALCNLAPLDSCGQRHCDLRLTPEASMPIEPRKLSVFMVTPRSHCAPPACSFGQFCDRSARCLANRVGYSRAHGRITRRTGPFTVATTVGSISIRRRKCRNAVCTVDFERPVFAAMVCKLTETVSRLIFAAWRRRNRYTTNVAGRRSCPTRSAIRVSIT